MSHISEAAAYMGCAVWFVREIIWGRRVPYVKFGKRYLLDRSDLDKFIDSEKLRA
jgi:excisionase family DNA binding protein